MLFFFIGEKLDLSPLGDEEPSDQFVLFSGCSLQAGYHTGDCKHRIEKAVFWRSVMVFGYKNYLIIVSSESKHRDQKTKTKKTNPKRWSVVVCFK